MRTRKPKGPTLAPLVLPPMPPPTAEEIAREEQLLAKMEEALAGLRQRTLNIAVALAQQAARGQGPLVDHFQELGRRYHKLLDAPQKPTLRVVKGGAK